MRFLPTACLFLACVFATSTLFAQRIDCQPCRHGFGQVSIGESRSGSIKLINSGSKTLRIRSITPPARVFNVTRLVMPITLQPGESFELPVSFKPPAKGTHIGTIEVASNALNGRLDVDLAGVGIEATSAQLVISPSSMNFGTVTLGATATLQATLTASGGAINISSYRSTNAEFTVSGPALPFRLASGSKSTVTITFKPSTAGTASGRFVVKSDAGNSPTYIHIAGTGAAGGSHEADLTWNASSGAVGYNVYRSGQHGGPYSKINTALDSSTSYSDLNVTGGNTYYYVATAVNSKGQESGYSNEISLKIPTP